jgi:hypothetical protein
MPLKQSLSKLFEIILSINVADEFPILVGRVIRGAKEFESVASRKSLVKLCYSAFIKLIL